MTWRSSFSNSSTAGDRQHARENQHRSASRLRHRNQFIVRSEIHRHGTGQCETGELNVVEKTRGRECCNAELVGAATHEMRAAPVVDRQDAGGARGAEESEYARAAAEIDIGIA